MSATFFKVTIDGKLRYLPVTQIKQAVVNEAEQPQVRLVLEGGGDQYLHGDEATAALALLEQLSSTTPATSAGARDRKA
jgi:hypothetical protein